LLVPQKKKKNKKKKREKEDEEEKEKEEANAMLEAAKVLALLQRLLFQRGTAGPSSYRTALAQTKREAR